MTASDEPGHDVVVVGAGIAGLCAAGELFAAGRRVLVIEKSRGVGGRMATRRMGDAVCDHGAQFFTIRGRAFGNVVGDSHRAGLVEKWCEGFPRAGASADGPAAARPADEADRQACWRGTRGMTDLPKRLAETLAAAATDGGGFELRSATRVAAIAIDGGRVRIDVETGEKLHASAAVVTTPAPQAIELFRSEPRLDADAVRRLEEIRYEPCFALMLALDRPSLVPPPGAIRFDEGPVAWLADNHVKGISPVPALTVHASAAFSREHFDAPPDIVADRLVEAVRPWIDGDPAAAIREQSLQRWKFSLAATTAASPLVAVSTSPPIVCCGDGFGGGRVEGAASSGLAAGRWLARR